MRNCILILIIFNYIISDDTPDFNKPLFKEKNVDIKYNDMYCFAFIPIKDQIYYTLFLDKEIPDVNKIILIQNGYNYV